MAPLQIYLIWCVYGIAIAILIAVASTFICAYQTPRDRSNSVTLMCIFSITVLLATVLLLPVDVALVSSTTSSALGQRKSWATQDEVDKITFSLTVVYYSLYSLDALLCLIGIPFTYFWYEEYDEVAAETGQQTTGQRFWATLKYTLFFISIVIVLFLVGFFIPISQNLADDDSDFLRRLFTENRGEHALTFSLGILITLGFGLYIMYTSSGLAMLPVLLMKTAPSFASPSLITSTAMQLNSNRERQRQLEGRCGGNPALLSPKDRRELDTLVREERTLARRQRLVDGAQEEQRSWLIRGFLKMDAILHPFKLLAGFILLLVALFLWTSLCGTVIDKLMNSPCKQHCGYILERINIFNPVNWVLIQSARVFPVDYFIFTLIILLFFCSSVVGISAIGIRFFWIQIFSIRKGHTSPQALLVATFMLMLITLAVNYTVAMVLAPQYATFGQQTFCDVPPLFLGGVSDCSRSTYLIKPCSEKAENVGANGICTPSVASTFLSRMTSNFPFFGALFSWTQFIFLGIYLLVLVVSISRSSRFDERQWDEDAEEAEEERLLAGGGRHATDT